MKQNYHYIVTFYTGKTCFCTCNTEEEASILAQAVMIKNGLLRGVKSIERTTNVSDIADTDFMA